MHARLDKWILWGKGLGIYEVLYYNHSFFKELLQYLQHGELSEKITNLISADDKYLFPAIINTVCEFAVRGHFLHYFEKLFTSDEQPGLLHFNNLNEALIVENINDYKLNLLAHLINKTIEHKWCQFLSIRLCLIDNHNRERGLEALEKLLSKINFAGICTLELQFSHLESAPPELIQKFSQLFTYAKKVDFNHNERGLNYHAALSIWKECKKNKTTIEPLPLSAPVYF